jgi:hypothetical protein
MVVVVVVVVVATKSGVAEQLRSALDGFFIAAAANGSVLVCHYSSAA